LRVYRNCLEFLQTRRLNCVTLLQQQDFAPRRYNSHLNRELGHLKPLELCLLKPLELVHLKPLELGHLKHLELCLLKPLELVHLRPLELGHHEYLAQLLRRLPCVRRRQRGGLAPMPPQCRLSALQLPRLIEGPQAMAD
jgi:hypothetical protein